MEPHPAKLGVDIGGTFTDVVLERGSGHWSTKLLTTHEAPERAVLAGVAQVLTTGGVAAAEVGLLVHGTTLATNALIERKGAKTALLTTEGFRDVIEMRGENRFSQHDLNIELPRPLVPRKWRFTVAERVDATGVVHRELDEAQLHDVAAQLEALEMEALAIGFLHSYRFARHEERARDILAQRLPKLAISISSEVSPEMREYERFSTACANAYVQPLMAGYLRRLQSALADAGFTCDLKLMLSGGGLATVETSCRFPVRLVESGPAGGAIFSASISRQCGLPSVVSFDMGGTTAKICLIDDGKPVMARVFEVARVYRFKRGSGLPLRIPVIEMVEIGAGGGSIATVDALGRVAVGPESAGSEPGPACYGRGGTEPTVTDADLILGRLDPLDFAGGSIHLDEHAATAAMHAAVGAKQQFDAQVASWAVSEIVEENMASAARVHAIEGGLDLSGRTLIAFGGAAPNHALRLAEKVGVTHVIIPSGAGVGSALGFLRAPISFEIVRTFHVRLNAFDAVAADVALEEMRAEARRIVTAAAGHDACDEVRSVSMRYAGQGHEILVALPNRPLAEIGAEGLRAAFTQEYQRVYGRLVEGVDAELLSWIVTVTAHRDDPVEVPQTSVRAAAVPSAVRAVYDAARRTTVEVPVFRRDELVPGQYFSGPAIVVERETSTLITASFEASINGWGYIECRKR